MASRRILVVDDEENIGRSLRMILEREGYAVLSAPDGATAAFRSGEHAQQEPDQRVDEQGRRRGFGGSQLRSAGKVAGIRQLLQPLLARTAPVHVGGEGSLLGAAQAVVEEEL